MLKHRKTRYVLISAAIILSLVFSLTVPAIAIKDADGKEFSQRNIVTEFTLNAIFSIPEDREDIRAISPGGCISNRVNGNNDLKK